MEHAPWYDESYQIWSHAICMGQVKRVDRIFELHPAHVWRDHVKPQWPGYLEWLKKCPTPIYMMERHEDIPSSVRYPRERIYAMCQAMIGRKHFGSQADFMIALALSEGVRHIALYGIHYIDPVKDGDRLEQLLAIKFWLGVAAGRGVTLEIPDGNPIFDTPAEVYAFESHSTKAKYQAKLDREKALSIAKPMTSGEIEKLVPSDGNLRPLPPMPWVPMPQEFQ